MREDNNAAFLITLSHDGLCVRGLCTNFALIGEEEENKAGRFNFP